MLAGIKSAYLLGRGFDDCEWIEGVTSLAMGLKLRIVHGPKWEVVRLQSGVPEWFVELNGNQSLEDATVVYICKTHVIERQLIESCHDGSKVTIKQEANLLGYPVCCVEDHYRRNGLLNLAFYKVVKRIADDDHDEMTRIIREDVQVQFEGEEASLFQEGTDLAWAPFTSINMCNICWETPKARPWRWRPSMRLWLVGSTRYLRPD